MGVLCSVSEVEMVRNGPKWSACQARPYGVERDGSRFDPGGDPDVDPGGRRRLFKDRPLLSSVPPACLCLPLPPAERAHKAVEERPSALSFAPAK